MKATLLKLWSRALLLLAIVAFAAAADSSTFGNLAKYSGEGIVVELDEAVARFDVGGRGRYFVFHFAEARKISVLDVVSGEWVGEIANVQADAAVCVGENKLVVASPGQRLLLRYVLPDCKRDLVAPLPDSGGVRHLVLGSNTDSPILLAGKSAMLLGENLRPLKTSDKVIGGAGRYGYAVRGSADGGTFAGIVLGIGPVSYSRMQVDGNKITTGNFGSTSHAIRWAQPSADGSLLFTPGGAADGKTLQTVSLSHLNDCRFSPTVDPRYFLAARFHKTRVDFLFCSTGDKQTIHSTSGFEEMRVEAKSRTPGFMPGGSERFYWIPWAGGIATIPADNKHVHLRRFHLPDALAANDPNFLFVDSIPPKTALRGESFEYEISAHSGAKKPAFELAVAPAGMSINKKGKIRWRVPEKLRGRTADVIVNVKNRKGREVFHSFELQIR